MRFINKDYLNEVVTTILENRGISLKGKESTIKKITNDIRVQDSWLKSRNVIRKVNCGYLDSDMANKTRSIFRKFVFRAYEEVEHMTSKVSDMNEDHKVKKGE